MSKLTPTTKTQKGARSNVLSPQNSSKVTKTAPKSWAHKANSGDTKPAHKSTSGLFSKEAPSRDLRFPNYGDLTAVEICTFTPNWLRSSDLLRRLFQNGLNTEVLARIINHHRVSPNAHSVMNNSLLAVFKTTMTEVGLEGWTVTKMNNGDFLEDNEIWDADNLSLAAIKVQCERFPNVSGNGPVVVDNVDFKSLAVGVKAYPDEASGDAHELTACVRYAVEHPDDDLQFPRDFQQLAYHLGQKLLRAARFDREVHSRWKRATKSAMPSADPSKATTPAKSPTRTQDIGAGKDSAKRRHFANTQKSDKGKSMGKDVDSSFLKVKKNKGTKKQGPEPEMQDSTADYTPYNEPPNSVAHGLMVPVPRGWFIIPSYFPSDPDFADAIQPEELQFSQQLGCLYAQDHHNLLDDAQEYVAPNLVPVALHDHGELNILPVPALSTSAYGGTYYCSDRNGSRSLPVVPLSS
jgi:hypothetical protein